VNKKYRPRNQSGKSLNLIRLLTLVDIEVSFDQGSFPTVIAEICIEAIFVQKVFVRVQLKPKLSRSSFARPPNRTLCKS
jgi:hypothetical protein